VKVSIIIQSKNQSFNLIEADHIQSTSSHVQKPTETRERVKLIGYQLIHLWLNINFPTENISQ